MVRKLALLLVLSVIGVFSISALAAWHADHTGGHDRHAKHEQERNPGHATHYAKFRAHINEDRNREDRNREDRNHERQRNFSQVHFFIADNKFGKSDDGGDRGGNDNRNRRRDGDRHGGRGGDRGRDDNRQDRRGDGNYGGWSYSDDRRGGNDRYRGRDRDRYRRDPWHRERYERNGHVYWRFNIRHFHRYDLGAWRGGYWHRGWYNDRWGWWWIVGGIWYYYPAPVYPYPNPYVPGAVVVINNQSDTPAPPSQAPAQFWYYCSSPQGYYPYVPECSGGWRKVAATSSNGTMPANPPPQSPATPASPPPPANPPRQSPAPAQSPAPVQYWYHCKSPEGYYPYVKTCPGGWERVPATPPSTGGSKSSGGG